MKIEIIFDAKIMKANRDAPLKDLIHSFWILAIRTRGI
jgi:hypothetical protein